MKCDRCDDSINVDEQYIYLDGYEKIFCCEDCLLEWLSFNRIITYEVATEENADEKYL